MNEDHPKYVNEFLDRVIKYKKLCDAKDVGYMGDTIREDPYVKTWADNLHMGVYPNKKRGSYKRIGDFMGIIPFSPCVMINISPAWKGKFGKDKLTDKLMIKKFQLVIEKYLHAAHRYSKWKYVLECGSEGNHLHAHIVAEINPKTEKSAITHLNKGNHAVDLRKIWNKNMPKGNEGYLKGKFAVQRIILRNEELKDDKLKYLIEEEKPEGHKNLRDLGILVNSGF